MLGVERCVYCYNVAVPYHPRGVEKSISVVHVSVTRGASGEGKHHEKC